MIPMLLWRAHRRQFVRALTTDRHVPLNCPALCVWGANTGVGKTLVSAGLAAAVARAEVSGVATDEMCGRESVIDCLG